ncbi:PHYB1, partial [Symbiodinium sp. CCMP2456]
MAVFGVISWQDEQVIITVFDVLAKILISAYVTSSRRTRSCVQLLGTRLVAANIAEDVRCMIRHAGVPIFSAGRDLRITEWNMKMQEISGLSREEAISMYLADALKVEGSEWWQNGGERLLLDALESNSGELEMIFSNQTEKTEDSVIVVRATGQRNPSGDITGVLCMGQDVSKVRAARNTAQALADSRSRLLVSANAPIIELDSEFRIVWWNNWMVDKTGVSVERITGQHLRLLAQSSSWEHILREALNRQGPE